MPTRPTKGDHGHTDAGSKGRGNQKATQGSSVSPEVAEAQGEARERTADEGRGDRAGDERHSQ